MGYQEALLPIDYLAEAAGVKKAIEEYAECYELPGYSGYFGTVHHETEGSMYVCFQGDSIVVGQVARIFSNRHYSRTFEYSDRYELISESLTACAAKQRPDLALVAYRRTKDAFMTVIERDRVRRQELDAEVAQLWPEVGAFLMNFGSTTVQAFKSVPAFSGHAMPAVLQHLERQGLVKRTEKRSKDEVELTEEAYKVLNATPKPTSLSLEDRLDLTLKEFGPLHAPAIAAFLNVTTPKANKILNELTEAGHVVKESRGRTTVYRLNETDSVELKAS